MTRLKSDPPDHLRLHDDYHPEIHHEPKLIRGLSQLGVAAYVGGSCRELGAASFLQAFFSTVSAHLEPSGWGTRFPALMCQLHKGKLSKSQVELARRELFLVQSELKHFPPSAVIWDIANRSIRPPWGDNIAPDISSLSLYFVTSEGDDLFDVLFATMDEALRMQFDVVLE